MNAHFSRSKKIKVGSKQAGIFSVEFALIGLFFSVLLAFSGDVIIKLSVKGKLDRLSYSLVNVLKERTQLYDGNYQLTTQDAADIDVIARNSLSRVFTEFDPLQYGLLVEELRFQGIGKPSSPFRQAYGSVSCQIGKPIENLTELSVISNRGRQLPIYRVSVCYETANWVGEILGENFTRVESDSVVIGR